MKSYEKFQLQRLIDINGDTLGWNWKTKKAYYKYAIAKISSDYIYMTEV